MLYIDDLVEEILKALNGEEHHCEFDGVKVVGSLDGRYCYVPKTHTATLSGIIDLLGSFKV